MKKIKIDKNFSLGIEFNYQDIENTEEEFTVVCFENDFSEEKYFLKLLNEKWINKVILIGSKPKSNFGKKLIVTDNLKEKFFKNSKNVFFIINTDIDEDVLSPIVQLFNIVNNKKINIGINDIIGFSYKENAILIKSLEALLKETLYEQYDVIYDYICDELDKKFSDNSICQFENDRCIVNRKYKNKDKIMGCCYSFKYNGLYFSDIKLCEYQVDKKCNTKCLGCKLFTCKYLKDHGIKFSLENMPIALAFFNKKQREIIRTTFFTTKENILEKLTKKTSI